MPGGIFQLLSYDSYITKNDRYIYAIKSKNISFIVNLYDQNMVDAEIEKCMINESIYNNELEIFKYLFNKKLFTSNEYFLERCIRSSKLDFIKYIISAGRNILSSVLLEKRKKLMLITTEYKNADIFNFLKVYWDISEYKNEILIDAIFSENLEIIKHCIFIGADAHTKDIKIIENCIRSGKDIALNYLLESVGDNYINNISCFKLPRDYSKKLKVIDVLINNGMPIHKIEDKVFKKYTCKECDMPCKNRFCEYCHFICDLNTDESCEQGYSCHVICMMDNIKCLYVDSSTRICTHCDYTCDCELKNPELLFYIINRGANIKKIFHQLPPKTKIAICKHILATIKIQKWILKIFAKPYYKDGSMGFLDNSGGEDSKIVVNNISKS